MKKMFSKSTALFLVAAIISVALISPVFAQGATEYWIKANTPLAAEQTIAVTQGSAGEIVLTSTAGTVGANSIASYSFPIEAVQNTNYLVIDVDESSTAGIAVFVYWNNGSYEYQLPWGAASAQGTLKIDLETIKANGVTLGASDLIVQIWHWDYTGTDSIVINKLGLTTEKDAAPAEKIFINEMGNFNNGGGAVSATIDGNKWTITTPNLNSMNSNGYFAIPVSALKTNPYLTLDISNESSAQATIYYNYASASLGSTSPVFLCNTEETNTLGVINIDTTSDIATLDETYYLYIFVYVVDSTGSENIIFNSISCSNVKPENALYFTASTTANYKDGGYYLMNADVTVSAGQGTEINVKSSAGGRLIYAFLNADGLLTEHSYLSYKIDEATAANISKIEVTNAIDESTHYQLSAEAGEHCYNIAEMVKNDFTRNYTYVCIYPTATSTNVVFDYIKLTDIDSTATAPDDGPVVPQVGYDITYVLNGGDVAFGMPDRMAENGSFTLLPVTKENADFVGWSDGTNTYKAGDKYTVTAATTLEAVYAEYGDISADGVIDVLDAVELRNMILGKNEDKAAADLNGDGVVDIVDIVMIKRMIFATV